MNIIEILLKEMDQEALTTRKMLSRVPEDKFGWKPHEKSMEMGRLAVHVAELPTWVTMAINTEGLDFADNPYEQVNVTTTLELVDHFEKSLIDGRSHLEKAKEENLTGNWTLRNGDEIYLTCTKYEMIRTAYCQIVHHRAQLGVYLRLLNIPIPGSYGPSADEQSF